MKNDFDKMLRYDVSKHLEKKQNQTYLSWTYAWSEFKKQYSDASYRVIDNENGLPYFESGFGIMVKTEVTANSETLPMWLPVMNGANKAMKSDSYSYKVKDFKTKLLVDKWVEAATMFDINKTIMRCLTKNIAMFGLGLYVFSGEDIPELEVLSSSQLQEVTDICRKHNYRIDDIAQQFGGFNKIADVPFVQFDNFISWLTPKEK